MATSDARREIKRRYPNLKASFRIHSRADPSYNCAAYAAGELDRLWWPWPNHYWPVEHNSEESVEEFAAAFATLGYFACSSRDREAGWEKIALYAKGVTERSLKVKHVAKQVRSGAWVSKLGPNEDILHKTLEELEGAMYGEVVAVLRRPVRARRRRR